MVEAPGGARLKEITSSVDPTPHLTLSGRNYDVTMPKATIDDLVRIVENSLVDRPVLNKTGLGGTYEIKLTYTPNTPANRENNELDDISIFSAVKTLGLQLKPEKAMIDVLIVDYAEKPADN